MKSQAPCVPNLDGSSLFDSLGEDPPCRERVFGDLTEAAALLDCLEIWGVSDSYLHTNADGTFVVQWRE